MKTGYGKIKKKLISRDAGHGEAIKKRGKA